MTQVEEQVRTREPMTVRVRKARKPDRSELVAVMARAFDDDPFANWVAAQDARRARRIYDFMETGLRITEGGNEIYTSDEIQGGAFWAPPRKWKLGILQQLLLTPAMIRTTTFRRMPAILAGLNAVEKKHPHEPHFYLLGLGVEPSLQGRGIGTQLMQPVLQICDRDGVPAYLESSKEVNVPLYERNGFKVTEEFVIPKGGPKIWLMWRDPQ